MTKHTHDKNNWSLTCFQDFGGHSSAAIIHSENGDIHAKLVTLSEHSSKDPLRRAVFLNTTEQDRVVMMNAETKAVTVQDTMPSDAFGIYYYPDPDQGVMWCTIDGDEETGADLLNCGENGAAIIVGGGKNDNTRILKTLCLGRGHHVVCITGATQRQTNFPKKAFVTSLNEGTLTVIGNDPSDKKNYLNILEVINLCQPDKEKDGTTGTPNNAFPHGMVFSEKTGKVYSLNNGYGNVISIDPVSHKIEKQFAMPVASNILLSPCGRFIIGKGADRKTDPKHVIGRLTVLDLDTGKNETVLDIPNVYPSTYRFTPDGKKLYVTTATTGKGDQKHHLDQNHLYIYDTSHLPKLALLKKVKVGNCHAGRRPIAFLQDGMQTPYVFNPNLSDGTVTIIDGHSDTEIKTVKVGDANATEVAFNYWNGQFYGS